MQSTRKAGRWCEADARDKRTGREAQHQCRDGIDPMSKSPPGLTDFALLALLAAIWGGSFMLIKVALQGFDPVSLTAWRLTVGGLAMLAVALAAGERLAFGGRDIFVLVLAGLFGNALPFVLISWGEETVDAGLAAILMGIMPMATLILAHYLSDGEALTGRKLAGVAIGFCGLVVLVGPPALKGLGSDVAAQSAILGAAICYAINAIVTKKLLHLPRRSAAAGIVMSGAIMVWVLALATRQPFDQAGGSGPVFAMVLLGVFPTAVAALIMFEVLQRQGAAFFGLVNLLVPPFGVAWALAVLGEIPDPLALVALALILGGIAVTRGRPAAHAIANPTNRINP